MTPHLHMLTNKKFKLSLDCYAPNNDKSLTLTRTSSFARFIDTQEKRERDEEEAARNAALMQLEEERELKKHRRELVHKAQPVPEYTWMKVKASTKAATESLSPMLGQKRSMRV